jgi:hypothetical protein
MILFFPVRKVMLFKRSIRHFYVARFLRHPIDYTSVERSS